VSQAVLDGKSKMLFLALPGALGKSTKPGNGEGGAAWPHSRDVELELLCCKVLGTTISKGFLQNAWLGADAWPPGYFVVD